MMISDPTLPGDPSSDDSQCVCDEWWIGRGDYTSNDGRHCFTHTIVLRCMWAVCTLVALFTMYTSWRTVYLFYRKAKASTEIARGVVSQNNTLNTVGTGMPGAAAGAGAGASAGAVGSSDGYCTFLVDLFHKMWRYVSRSDEVQNRTAFRLRTLRLCLRLHLL
jgi:hypothetical protein